jgi:hypothetical protein
MNSCGGAIAEASRSKISRVLGTWSLDARVLVRPARTFESLAAASARPRGRAAFWLAARRPLFLTFVLACVISLLATSVATLRLIPPTMLYWAFVPVVEILALAIVLRRRRGPRGLSSLIDAYFAGHAAWTLLLLTAGAVVSVVGPQHWWFLITRPAIAAVVIVAGWSAYVDICFFRHVCGAPFRRAVRDAVVLRVIVWTLVFWIFAVPEPTPFGVIQEIVEAIKEVIP